MKKFEIKMEESKIIAGFDGNMDGEKSIEMKLNLGESLEEFMQRKELKLDVKSLNIKMEESKIILGLDIDKDGESVLELSLDLVEGIDEAF